MSFCDNESCNEVNVVLIYYLDISHEHIIAKFVQQIENKSIFYAKGLKINKKNISLILNFGSLFIVN
jgi:hypothetical protein